jgi:hypothetical protein
MATITTSPDLIGQGGPFAGQQVSGTFIPTLWSSQLNWKFYKTTMFSEIANTKWEGEIKGLGDKIVINQIPTLTVNTYVIGAGLNYEAPAPSTITLQIDRAKYFAFQVNDVIDHQSKPNLMDMFTNDASMQLKIAIDSNVLYNTFSSAHASNKGATAGVNSGSYALGTDVAPVALTGSNILQLLTSFSGVLDEQNVPETERYICVDPYTRNLLMQSNLAQAQFMGDSQSMVRTGKIGRIDRFDVYVTNNLPKAIAGTNTPYLSGAGDESSITTTGGANLKRRIIVAGHKSAISFASQITKTETVRNPSDFGDYVRSLMVYGFTVVKPESLAYAVVS